MTESYAQVLKTWYRKAIYVEAFANSPIGSVNYEYLPVRWHRAFLSTRAGVGYVPTAGISVPLSVTYNFLPSGLKDRFQKQVYTKCNPHPPKRAGKLFIETGAGYTFGYDFEKKQPRNYYFGIIGIRANFVFNLSRNPQVLFFRAMFTPTYISTGRFEPRAGIGIGISLLEKRPQ